MLEVKIKLLYVLGIKFREEKLTLIPYFTIWKKKIEFLKLNLAAILITRKIRNFKEISSAKKKINSFFSLFHQFIKVQNISNFHHIYSFQRKLIRSQNFLKHLKFKQSYRFIEIIKNSTKKSCHLQNCFNISLISSTRSILSKYFIEWNKQKEKVLIN